MVQNVDRPTRARGNDEPHLLDLVITNDYIIEGIEYLAPLGKSDHSLLNIKCKCKLEAKPHRHRLNYEKGNYDAFRNYLKLDWEDILKSQNGDLDKMWCVFRDYLLKGTNLFIPQVKDLTSFKEKWKRPLSKGIRSDIKNKSKLWKKFVKCKDKLILDEYKKISNRVRKQTREASKEEQMKIAKECKNNPKKFWNYVRSKTNSHDKIADLHIKDEMQTDKVISSSQEKANILCDYFSRVFNKDAGRDDIFGTKKHNTHILTMASLSISIEDIIKKLNNLNIFKSPGPDQLHPKILKEVKDVIALPLKIIVDTSLALGILPKDWKSGDITPIFKKGKKTDVQNYRPISLTSVICKVLESLIRDRILQHFKDNNLFYDRQYGFIKGRSTVTQLLNIMDKWTECLENGGQVDVIYTDLEKAFDKVPHKSLISKLKGYKIDNNIIRWINSFLTNRVQRVRVDDSFSKWANVLSGIPQGTVLGPLLFIIFINDIMETCEEGSELFVYADDAKLFNHIKSTKDVINLQTDLEHLDRWIKDWSLTLNIKKCNVVSYGRKANITHNDYFIGSDKIERTNLIKDLGVTFDPQLKFSTHIKEKVNKAYARLGIIKRNFNYMSPDVFCLLYKAMIRSHLEYASSVWNPHCKEDIEILEKVQRRATKLVKTIKHLSYEDRLKTLKLPTLKYRRIRGDLIEVFKIVTSKDNNSNSILITHKGPATRGNNFKLYQKHIKYDLRKYFFTNRVVALWNSLPDYVVSSGSMNIFKNCLDKFLQNQSVLYDWEADICGTGDRSESVFKTEII